MTRSDVHAWLDVYHVPAHRSADDLAQGVIGSWVYSVYWPVGVMELQNYGQPDHGLARSMHFVWLCMNHPTRQLTRLSS